MGFCVEMVGLLNLVFELVRVLLILLTNIVNFMDSSYTSSTTRPIYRGTQIVWYVLGIIEVLLAFRFVLRLLGANPDAGFSTFIYWTTYLFANPFLSVFNNTQLVSESVFEWTTLLAMFFYWVVAVGIIKLLFMGKSVSTPEAAVKLDEEEHN